MAQHDYDIANGTGSAVRADINSVLDAIQSCNSGSSAPASTVAYQLWYDTTNYQLKIRNKSNNAWLVLADFASGDSAPTFLAADGSTSETAYGNTGNANTGVYFPASDTVAVSCGGSKALQVAYSGSDVILTLGA